MSTTEPGIAETVLAFLPDAAAVMVVTRRDDEHGWNISVSGSTIAKEDFLVLLTRYITESRLKDAMKKAES